MAGETTPPADKFRGEGNVRLFDAGALVEAPYADGRGTVLAGGRYSYTAFLISQLAPNTVVDYWDYQTRVTYRLSDRDQISVFALGSYDSVSSRDEGEEDLKEVINLRGGKDGPSEFYLNEIATLHTKGLPPGWDGIIELASK